jgi:hypothetical protein
MTEIKTFKIAVLPGYESHILQEDVIKAIEYKGRIIIIHSSLEFGHKYRASDYATGRSFGVPGNNLKMVIRDAKLRVDEGISIKFDYSKYETLNK